MLLSGIPRQRSARVVFSISRREWEFLGFNLVHRDETENSWRLLSGFETRPSKNCLQSWAARRDRDLSSSLSGFGTRTRISLIWSCFRDKTENSESCHLSLNSGMNGLTILHAISGRLTILNAGPGPSILLDVLPFWNDPVMFSGCAYCDFLDCCHKCHKIECFESSDLQIVCFESQILVSHLTTAWCFQLNVIWL